MTTGTVGSVTSEATIPSAGFAFIGLNSNTQAWSTFTMPTPGGRITKLHVYFDARVAMGNGDLVLWDGSGNVLATAAVTAIPVGGGSAGHQAWHNAALAGNGVYVKGGATISIGFWMPGASGFEISSISGGASTWNGVGFAGPSAQSAPTGSTGIGTIGAFGEYVLCLRKTMRGGVLVETPRQVMRGGVLAVLPRWVMRSGVLVQVQ